MPDLITQRKWFISVGSLSFSSDDESLDVDFEVEKNVNREPNSCRVKIYNLTRAHSDMITGEQTIRIDAGYENMCETIFLGKPRSVRRGRNDIASKKTYNADIDRITEIEAEDAGSSYLVARLDKSYGPGTSCLSVMTDAASAMGVGLGNLQSLGTSLERSSGPNVFSEGYTANGTAWQIMDRLVRSRGLTWSIQDGVVQLRRGNTPLMTKSIHLAPGAGLLGSPTKDKDGTVQALAHLIPGLTPGCVIVLDSAELSGNFQINRVRYIGSTAGDQWDTQLTLEDY